MAENKKDVNQDGGNAEELAGKAAASGGKDGGTNGAKRKPRGTSRRKSAGSGENGTAKAGSERSQAATDLLARIKSNRKSLEELPASEQSDGASRSNVRENVSDDAGHNGGSANDLGTESESNRGDLGSSGSRRDRKRGARRIAQTAEQEELKDKPAGVALKGLGNLKIPKMPKVKRLTDEKPLTEKESKDLEPKMVEIVKTVFRYFDLAISFTNRERAEANIWRGIDADDCAVIASLFIDVGKKNPAAALVVRKLSTSYRMLQVGIITLPRFVQTYQFYLAHGGFTLFPSQQMQEPKQERRMNHAATQSERKNISGGQNANGKQTFVAPTVKEG